MALSSTTRLKLLLGISASDTSQDSRLAQILTGVEAGVKAYLKRDVESATYTEFYDGSGKPKLVLRQYPVTSVTTVHLDARGYYGTPSDAFASTTLLTAGTDYVLPKEDSGGSRPGFLLRIGGPTVSGEVGWWPPSAWNAGYPSGHLLTGRGPTAWPRGRGNLKVVYVAGYTSVPADIALAVDQTAAWVSRNGPQGGFGLTGESLEDYSYNLASAAIGALPELGSARQLLAPYRRLEWEGM